ncbi:outer membrane beta-barrel protein [Flavobacterium aestivum]|uniref:outer membrane beta-barrel protein n=1 Tax=Flavobacterium aestivum TaxID=3003257 RepID=UPI0024824117|nr:outer membrane beta-barrel protein [Flavobacterium aestivum]
MKFNKQISKGILILLLSFFGILQAQAQVSFRPGLRAGANFSHFTKGGDYYYYNPNGSIQSGPNVHYDTKTDFYIGFYGALKLSKYYTLQPEIDYSSQGSEYRSSTNSAKFDVDYLSFEVLNKFTFGNQFNLHFGPTLDFVVNKNFNTDANVDMAFVLGAGINITRNFGIEGRVKKGIIPVLDFNDNHTNVVFSLGATYTFDVK